MSSNLNASGFEGKEIQLETFSPNRETPSSNKLVDTVGEGFEFTDLLGDQLLSGGNRVDIRIDFSANSILFDFSESSPYTRTSSGTFNGYVFTDVSGTIPEISNVTIDETITNLGLDSSDITFTEDSIEVNVEGLSFNTDTIAKLDVEFGGTLANAQIKGTVWNDLNDDGVLDSGEQGQAEVQIYLDTNNNGVLDADEPVTTTDESGKYEFTSLEPGTYIVREVIPQRFKQTFPLGSNTNIGDSFADVVLESFNSATGEPFPNETDVLGDTSDFVSLTKDSFITVEFTDETLIDSPGNDLFIEEEGSASEKAEVFVSSDAQEFVFLGTADGGTVTEFDLSTISFTEPVKAVKIVGLDNLGSAPGFDVESIQVLPDSIASPDFYSVDVAEGETVENINFGNTRGNPLEVIISAPRSIAANGTDEITVTYRNVGDTEIAAPLLNLEATGGLFRPGLEREFSDSEVQFLGINNQGVPGVLPPGASNTFTVEFIPDAASGDTINFSVSTINPDETIDWESLRASLKPSNLTEEAWNPIYDNFIAETGTTAGDYQQLLIKNANYFAEIGEYVADADRLVGFEFQQASDYQALTQRNSLGSFGVGGGFLGDIRVVVDEDGNVSIVSPGTSRGFSIQDDGSYLAAPGDFGTLSLVEGRYTLTSQSGTVTEFLADGQLDFIEDTNGNRLTAEYTEGSLLTGLVASNGDSLTFTRNDDGLITSVADSLGNITTYTYDGNLLTTVSTPEGTISYTYNDANAVSSITDANGTQVSFEYDSRGRLIKESVNAGAEEITYSYGENGEVTVNDSSGASSNFLLNDFGQVAQVTDSLDRTVDIDYDELGNPITITAPDGSRLGLGYDSAGNVTSQIDPLGHITTFSYEPNFNFLDTVTDPRGNTLDYDYDESGNLTTITYADGSKETFAYDGEGNVTQSVNRRGQGIDYQYNNRGQLLNQANADGSATGYIYDEGGNLVSATDASGTTTLEYDAADRLTKITYGNGRSLAYTYDAGGRRTSMTDGNGNGVNYSYDAVSRLAGLTDGDGNAIVTYSYDDVGRLVREDNGNGTYTTYTYDLAGQVT
ncbi:MAG: SdrD B-like domain-containing protein, partial [Cyanobacteria bacterium P01_D01_bin.50]